MLPLPRAASAIEGRLLRTIDAEQCEPAPCEVWFVSTGKGTVSFASWLLPLRHAGVNRQAELQKYLTGFMTSGGLFRLGHPPLPRA